MILTHLQTRLLHPGLAQLTDPHPPAPSGLRTAARDYQRALDRHTHRPDSLHELKLDSIKPTLSVLAHLGCL